MKARASGCVLFVALVASCRGNGSNGGDGIKVIVEQGTGPAEGGYTIVDPRAFSSLYMMNGQATVVSLGTAGTIPSRPSYRIRFYDPYPDSTASLRGAVYTEYDDYDVPYSVERIVQVPQPYCQQVVADQDLVHDYASMLGPVYPRYLDASGREIAAAPLYPGILPIPPGGRSRP